LANPDPLAIPENLELEAASRGNYEAWVVFVSFSVYFWTPVNFRDATVANQRCQDSGMPFAARKIGRHPCRRKL